MTNLRKNWPESDQYYRISTKGMLTVGDLMYFCKHGFTSQACGPSTIATATATTTTQHVPKAQRRVLETS